MDEDFATGPELFLDFENLFYQKEDVMLWWQLVLFPELNLAVDDRSRDFVCMMIQFELSSKALQDGKMRRARCVTK